MFHQCEISYDAMLVLSGVALLVVLRRILWIINHTVVVEDGPLSKMIYPTSGSGVMLPILSLVFVLGVVQFVGMVATMMDAR